MPSAGSFDLPQHPDGLRFPHTSQIVVTSVMGALVLVFACYAVREIVRHRSYLLALLLIGGGISYLNEPIDDVLGCLYHPVDGQWTVLDTFAKVPLWGLGIYVVFFGGMPYLILKALERGVTRRQLWQWVGILFVVDVAVEIPILARDMYVYYADPPFDVAGFPLYWLFINVGGPFEVAVLLYAARHLFTGWRAAYLVALPTVCDAAGSIAVGWPIYSALNAQASQPVKWVAGAATIALGYLLLDLTITWAARKSGQAEPDRDVAYSVFQTTSVAASSSSSASSPSALSTN
jgi:hypothetical protein